MIKAKYEELVKDRDPFETRAELCASVTLPFMFPSDSFSSQDDLDDNMVQGIGGIGVNSLAAKLALSLMPAQGRFFRMQPDAAAEDILTGGDAEAKAKTVAILSQGEEQVLGEIEKQNIRTEFYTILKHLIISGNCLMEKIENDGLRIHSLRNYVVRRGTRGKPVLIILKEIIDSDRAPEGIELDEDIKETELYTMFKFEDGKWIRTQEVDDNEVGKEATFDDRSLPVQPLGWNFVNNEDYARTYVEDFVGDLIQYEKATQMFWDGNMAQAKVVYAVNPLGRTRKKDVADAANLDIIDGVAEDVQAIQTNKTYDLSGIAAGKEELKRQIGRYFLDSGSVQRNAERVTAEEIQLMIRELETNLAGTFSLLSNDLLLQIVKWIIDELNIEIDDGTDIRISVGVDALSRGQQADVLMGYVNAIHSLKYQDYLNEGETARRLANYMGVNSVDLLMTPKQVQDKRARAAQAAQAQQMNMQGAGKLGENSANQVTGGQQNG